MKNPNFFTLCISLFIFFCFSLSLHSQVTWDQGGDGTSWGDPLNWDSDSEPLASDDVIIPDNSNVSINDPGKVAKSVAMGSNCTFIINTNGVLIIDGSDDDGFSISKFSDLTVDGQLLISNVDLDNYDGDGIHFDTTTTLTIGKSGTVKMDWIGSDGIYSPSETDLTVNGNLKMTNIYDEGIELNSNSNITIGINGFVKMESLFHGDDVPGAEGGCAFELDGVEVTNNGTIYYKNGSGDGIELDNSTANDGTYYPGLFTNTSTGRIIIDNLRTGSDEAIEVQSGNSDNPNKFINDGYILLSNIKLSDGIQIESYGIFENNCGIRLMGVDDNVINLSGTEATFINRNLINLARDPGSTTSDTSAIRIANNSQFINESCGIINITTPNDIVTNSSNDSLINDGIITTIYTANNINDGVFENSGELRGSNFFPVSGNPIDNTGTITNMGEIPTIIPLVSTGCNTCSDFANNEIPTMGQWSLIILSLLLFSLGIIGIRQKNLVKA